MKRFRLPLIALAIVTACGDSTGPIQGLDTGLYGLFVPASNPNVALSWRSSWPVGVTQPGCAYIGGSIQVIDATHVTETRVYSNNGTGSAFFTTQATLPGTYRTTFDGSNVYIFSIDGGTDTVSQASTVIDGVQHEELMMRRWFPARGSCASTGPLDMSYVK